MNMFAMQFVEYGRRIGILRVKLELSGACPPRPILDYIVNWNLQLAVIAGDVQNLLLRRVFVLALPGAVHPFAEQWTVARERPEVGGELIEARGELIEARTVTK